MIAPALSDDMEAAGPSLHALERRAYGKGDASAFRLVVTATGIPEVDGAVYADAEAAGVWANSADDLAQLLVHPPGRASGRCGHRLGVDRRAQSGAGLLAPDPPGGRVRGAGSGSWPSCWARPRASLKQDGRPSDSVDWARLLDGPLPDWSAPATSTAPGQP